MRRARGALVWCLWGMLSACGLQSAVTVPSEATRARIGTLGFAAVAAPETQAVSGPAQGWAGGIVGGACDGWNLFFDVGSDPSADVAAIVGLLAPVGLVVGAFVGPFATMSAEDVDPARSAVTDCMRNLDWQLSDELREEVRAETDYATESGSGRPADCRLEIVQVDFGLSGRCSLNPYLKPYVELHGRVVTLPADEPLHEFTYREEGLSRLLLDWAAHTDELRNAFDWLRRTLVEKIVEDVLLVCPPENLEES